MPVPSSISLLETRIRLDRCSLFSLSISISVFYSLYFFSYFSFSFYPTFPRLKVIKMMTGQHSYLESNENGDHSRNHLFSPFHSVINSFSLLLSSLLFLFVSPSLIPSFLGYFSTFLRIEKLTGNMELEKWC